MRTDTRKPPADAIAPPRGYQFYARRLNRHRYHLTHTGGDHATILCGVTDESSTHTMTYLLAHDSRKRCVECLTLAGAVDQVEEVRMAQAVHEEAEAAQAVKMCSALKALHFPGDVKGLSPDQLRDELRRIEHAAADAWRGLPF